MIRKEIKAELESRKWSITKLSTESGVRYASLTEFINGSRNNLSIENIEKVFEALDITLIRSL